MLQRVLYGPREDVVGKGLGEQGNGTRRARCHLTRLGQVSGNHDDGDSRVSSAGGTHEVEAVAVGQSDVGDKQRR